MFKLPGYDFATKRVSVTKTMSLGTGDILMDIAGPGIIKHMWFTFPTRDLDFSRKNILKIYWDDEETPSVESPLGDFFCVPMGCTGKEYAVNSYFIIVAPQNGLNCYFPMPFAKRARVEIHAAVQESGGGFYFQADYEDCIGGLPEEWKDYRFHAKYRMESSTEVYGHRYTTLDAEGEGFLVGASYGIRRTEKQPDEWYHGGGDLVLIDGEAHSNVIHGIGAEDFFGHSWGVEECNLLYVGNPYSRFVRLDDRNIYSLGLYRFFVHDPVRFKSSIIHMLGAMGDSISSVAYWYQKEPHRDFFRLPSAESLGQDSNVPRGSCDVEPDVTDTWSIFGPVDDKEAESFDEMHPLELNMDKSYSSKYVQLDGKEVTVSWSRLEAPRGFLDFNVAMRPAMPRIKYPTGCYAFAYGLINMAEAGDLYLRVGFDDRVRVWMNGEVVLEKEHEFSYENEVVPVKLKAGRNEILVKLSNTTNTNFKAWVFNMGIADKNGEIIKGIRVMDS